MKHLSVKLTILTHFSNVLTEDFNRMEYMSKYLRQEIT